jgi:ectoine hydroxylase-related dioxygenase (phytanoyl-CoA dioxygenase family)
MHKKQLIAGKHMDGLARKTVQIGNEDGQELRAELMRNGFASASNITDADDIMSIRDEITDLWANRGSDQPQFNDLGDTCVDDHLPSILEILSPSALRPRLLTSRFIKRAIEISRDILGSSAEFQFDHCIAKPPFNAAATSWHQDCVYHRLNLSPHRLHWWLPLQDATMENGCMQFIPGSHLGPVLPHTPRSAGAYALQAQPPRGTVAVACPLNSGSATIHLPWTLHYTGPNNTGTTRYAWIVQIGSKQWRPWHRPLKKIIR